MSQEDVSRIEAALLGYFFDAKAALAAALSEVRNAAHPEVAEAVRAEFGESLTVTQAVLLMAIKRGELWLPFNTVQGGISRKIKKTRVANLGGEERLSHGIRVSPPENRKDSARKQGELQTLHPSLPP